MLKPEPSTPSPIPNSYWVIPGRLLAGEYPGGSSRADAMQRLQKLLAAGVTSFLDLTEEEELPAYHTLLLKLTEQTIRHKRWSISDHGIPESPKRMSEILDYLDAELRAGRCVYVHCRAGIGRTGTTIACHLIRTGLANDAALDRLQSLWRFCARSQNWPHVPETDEQLEFVRVWRDQVIASTTASVETQARYEGAIVGLALGDALAGMVASSGFEAAALIARSRESDMWSSGANTATTRAVLESLLAQGKHEPRDQLQRYLDWTRQTTAPVPPELKRALAVWQWSKKVQAGSHDPKNLDPHTLARALAPALYAGSDPARAIELAVETSRTTQQSPVVLDLCRVWCASFIDALNGAPATALRARSGPAMSIVRKRQLKPAAKSIVEGPGVMEPTTADDALAVTAYAFARFAEAKNFHDALLSCVTARATNTSAASLCGALAGAHFGIDAIPAEWRAKLTDEPALRSLARHCLH
jgi:ADP-ribosylglycohydrolase